MELLLPIMIVALLALLFFQSSRQRKAAKAVEEMQSSLGAGDRVLTTSGLRATVVSTDEESVILEIAPGVKTEWDRRVIREKLTGSAESGQV